MPGDEFAGVLVATVLETQLTGEPVIDERTRTPDGPRLIDELRSEVVKGWSESGVADFEMPSLLLAMERVRDALTPPSTAEALLARKFLVDVAHDLRSPLTSVLFLTETLQRGLSGAVNELQRRQLRLIYAATLGLNSVANDIIDLLRSDKLIEPEPIPFSVSGVLDSVYHIVRPMAEEKQLAVRMVPPGVGQRMGHPVALSRVLLNLTTNALKFTEQGYVEIVTREPSSGRVEFSVRDTGKGIEPAIVATIFNVLRSSAEHTGTGRLFSQTGLGLSICRKLVQLMGGHLQVETRHGSGTRFYFELELPDCPSLRGPERAATDRRAGEARQHNEHKRRNRD